MNSWLARSLFGAVCADCDYAQPRLINQAAVVAIELVIQPGVGKAAAALFFAVHHPTPAHFHQPEDIVLC
jgi:hypothetical protein